MIESHRATFWTTIVRLDHPKDAKLRRFKGSSTPFVSEQLWQAESKAKTRADARWPAAAKNGQAST